MNNFELKPPVVTLVTGIWDLGRSNLTEGWARPFDHYIEKFKQLLEVDCNLIIFGDEHLKKIVFEFRNEVDTLFILRDLDWFKDNDYYQLIQNIRVNPDWYNQVGWLSSSTQAKLEMYNPLVMSKVFLLHDAKILDKFNSDYLFWIDGGLTNTVHQGYFTHDKVLDKLPKYFNKFSFICFPYEANTEIHGFDYKKINSICNNTVNKVARAGFFGGPINTISDINSIYYSLLLSTLQEGLMGTEESIFTIMCYQHPDLINFFEIESNGLIGLFFENLKNDNLVVRSESVVSGGLLDKKNKVGLYIITFNSPNQLQTLINSMLAYDQNFVYGPQLILLDNSSDLSTQPQYSRICEKYNITHIKKDNLGICGGRQFIAEHAEEHEFDFYFFFEDDMFFYPKKGEICKNGFNRWVENLYDRSLEIINNNSYDFLKLSFTEFFGDNKTQWSWYNVPQSVREELWPENPKLPVQGLDPNAPNTNFKNINSVGNLPYIDGEIYYSNWPQVVSREGNKKMFLETKWAHPYEQTWMSHIYQETKKGKLNPAILLLTPTEHNRFDHYDRELRKES
jgi:hypothetical protein